MVPQIVVLRRQLDVALDVRGSVAAPDYARAATEMLDTVQALIDGGHAAEARPLARHAVERITRALLLIDDRADTVVAACDRALELYALACRTARPPGPKLARWLFQLQLDSPGWPSVDLSSFADALGEAGLGTYRALVDEAWEHRSTGSVDEADIRMALTLLVIREKLAKFDGGVVVMDGALADGLPTPAAFLGVSSGDHAPWLVEFLVQAYLDGGRGGDALELRRAELRSRPVREHYAKLRETAEALDRWAEVRPWALDLLRRQGSGDDLIGALLDDGEPDAAWAAAADRGCAEELWLVTARHRANEHPEDVLPGYRALVGDRAARTGRRNYRETVALLEELRTLAIRCDRLAEYTEFLAALRSRHRRKPALLDELNRADLGGTPVG